MLRQQQHTGPWVKSEILGRSRNCCRGPRRENKTRGKKRIVRGVRPESVVQVQEETNH